MTIKAIKNIAVGAYGISARALFGIIFVGAAVGGLSACSILPEPPSRSVLYDFGPGTMQAATDRQASLPPLALADVESPGIPEGSNAVLYRLAYADSQQLRPYSQARWSQPPALLLQQHLREQLGQRRAVLTAEQGAAQARNPAASSPLPLVLKVELEEFSHIFTSPAESAGVVRLRATVVELGPLGQKLRGQRGFVVQEPARTADAAGGVAALRTATTRLASELAQWLEPMAPTR